MTRFHYANTSDANMLYMAKHHIADPFFFLEHDGVKRIFLSSTDREAFLEENDEEVEVVDVGPLASQAAEMDGDRTANLALVILKEFEVEEVVVPSNFPIALADAVRAEMLRLTVVLDWCPERAWKSPLEISALRDNFEHTIKAYELIEAVLQESKIDGDTLSYRGCVLTSECLRREVAKLLLDYDLTSPEGMIISCGKHAAMPHHMGTGPIHPGETIVVDIFPQSTKNHYFADMTRTYVKGELKHPEVQKMYEAVLEAHEASLRALRSGAARKAVYEISADVIKAAGFDVGEKGYTHSLGHGLGVAIHEAPNLSPRSEGVLEVGHVVTVEPGLYYPAWGGVRIEDTVVITENGYENLTNYPKKLFI